MQDYTPSFRLKGGPGESIEPMDMPFCSRGWVCLGCGSLSSRQREPWGASDTLHEGTQDQRGLWTSLLRNI